MYRLFTVILVVVSVLGSTCPAAAEWAGTHLETKKSVVRIFCRTPSYVSWGSGFAVGKVGEVPEYFVTNRHVVCDEDTGKILDELYLVLDDEAIFLEYLVHPNTGKYKLKTCKITKPEAIVRCEVLYPTASNNPEYPDIAILKAERPVTERAVAPLKSGWDVETGIRIFTMGFPGSADTYLRLKYTGEILYQGEYWRIRSGYMAGSANSMTVADGVISSIVNVPYLDNETVFQHTAQMNHGNSGGPLVTEDGYVVAINTYGFHPSDTGFTEYNGSVFIDYVMIELDNLGIPYDTNRTLEEAAAAPTAAPTQAPPAETAEPTAKPTAEPVPKPGDPAQIVFWIVAVFFLLTVAGGVTVWLLLRRKNEVAYVLVGKSGFFADRQIPIGKKLQIGRDAASGLAFPSDTPGISMRHCLLEVKDGVLTVCDLGSSYGTFVNGKKLSAGEPVALREQDVLALADRNNTFVAARRTNGGK